MKDMYNFEKNLKKKLDENEFPFDEKNWEKASAMIDASRSNKKPFMFFMLSAIALLVTTGAVYFFYNSSPDNSTENLLAVNNSSIQVKETSLNAVDYPNEINTVSKESKNIQTDPSTPVSEPASSLTAHKSGKTENYIKSHITSNNKHSEETANIASAENNNNKNNPSANLTSGKSDFKNTSASNKPGSNSNTSATTNAGNYDKAKNTTVKEIPVVLGSNSGNNLSGKTNSSNTPENANTNKLGNIVNPVAANVNPAISQSKVTDSVPAVRAVTDNTLIVNSIDSVNIIPSLVTDSTAFAISIAAPFQAKKTTDFLYAEAGASYLLGWNSNGIQEANGFNLVAGFNYLHYFNTIISFGIGAQYTSINNLSQSTYTVSRVNYDFGVSKDITSIKYIRLHYVTVPVKLGFNVGKNNVIGVGANISMLLTDEYRDERHHTNNAEPMTDNNQLSTKKGNGYFAGFNPYDIQASVFYRRKLAKGLSINAEFGYGLMDIKNNSHFKNGNFEKSTGGKLTLCYDLFKK